MADTIAKRPDFSQGIWAEQGELQQPSVDKIEIGHVVERPPFQLVNWIENRQDQGLLYLLQNGLSSWDKELFYPQYAFTTLGGVVYQALQQNTGQDPNISKDYWVKAFYSKTDGDNLKDIINKIQNEDGFLSLYVKKSDPVLDSTAKGTGYAFKTANSTGLFLDDNKNPTINKDGTTLYSFSPIVDLDTESNNKVVRMSDLRTALSRKQAFPIGSIYINTGNNPNAELGYGTWEKFGQGKTLVGQSDSGDDPNWVRSVGQTYGEYNHKLTKTELPNEKIQLNATGYHRWIGNRNGVERKILNNEYYDGIDKDNTRNPMYTYPLGDGTPHNNVQPSIVVTFWKRTS